MKMTDRNTFDSPLCLCASVLKKQLPNELLRIALRSLQFVASQITQETVRRHLASYVKAVSHFFSIYRKCDLILSLTDASNAMLGAGYKAPDRSGFHGVVWPTECIVPA